VPLLHLLSKIRRLVRSRPYCGSGDDYEPVVEVILFEPSGQRHRVVDYLGEVVRAWLRGELDIDDTQPEAIVFRAYEVGFTVRLYLLSVWVTLAFDLLILIA